MEGESQHIFRTVSCTEELRERYEPVGGCEPAENIQPTPQAKVRANTQKTITGQGTKNTKGGTSVSTSVEGLSPDKWQ